MLVLASASPRRQEILRNADIAFTVQPTDIPEEPRPNETPQACAERLAREKATAAFRTNPDCFVLGADTIVVVDGQMLGKPVDAKDAARMLRLLSGRTHQVITGVCLIHPQHNKSSEQPGTQKPPPRTASETTLVYMDELTDDEIKAYIATGEPMDKAGAYAIQGVASRWISRIEGDYFNVVGLPMSLVYRMLREHGAV